MSLIIPSEVQRMIPRLKQKYGKVFGVEVDGLFYAFRGLTYQEFVVIRPLIADGGQTLHPFFVDLESFILESTILFPYPYQANPNALAGSAHRLVRAIVKASGFSQASFEESFAKYQELVNTDSDYYTVLTICKAFTSLTPDIVRSWPHEKLVEYFAMALALLTPSQPQNNQAQPSVNPIEPRSVKAQRVAKQNPAPSNVGYGVVSTPTVPAMKSGFIDIEKENASLRQFIGEPRA